MPGTLADLATRARKIEAALPARVSQVAVDTALQLTQQLAAIETPVDTSQALSNWQVGVGQQPGGAMLPPFVPGKGGSTRAESAAEAVENAKKSLAGRKQGQVIYLSNVAPYIRRLAYEGWSKQAPPGWIESSVLRARKFVGSLKGRLLSGL